MPKVLTIAVDVFGTEASRASLAKIEAQIDATAKAAAGMGKEIDKTATSHRAAAPAAQQHTDILRDLTKQVVAYVSISAVIGAIRNTAAWGDEIQTLSKRLGSTTTEVQQLNLAAKTNGTSIESVTNAIGQLSSRLAGGDTSALDGLERLHLSFQDVSDDSPVEAFINIAHAVARIPDPMERARAATELFGKSGRELLPLLVSDIDAVMRRADELGAVISPLLVKKAAELNTTFDEMTIVVKATTMQGLEPMLDTLRDLSDGDLYQGLQDLSRVIMQMGPNGQMNPKNPFEDINLALATLTAGAHDAFDALSHLSGFSLLQGSVRVATTGAPSSSGAPPAPAAPGLFSPSRIELSMRRDIVADLNDSYKELERIEAQERREAEQSAKELARMHHELVEDLRQVEQASREAFDAEIANAYMSQLRGIKGLTEGLRDDYASIALSGAKLKEFQINEAAARARADVDPRAGNADAMLAQLEAKRQLQLLMLKKDTEGLTDELQQQFLIFRQTYQDVLGGLPPALEGVVPEIAAASGQIRDVITNDLDTVGGKAQSTFVMMGTIVQRTASELMDAAAQIENDLNDMQQGMQGPFGYRQFQEETAQRLRGRAGRAASHEPVAWGQSDGGIAGRDGRPIYAAQGWPARGTDTIPIMATPGEGMLSLKGMEALGRLNSGRGLGGGGPVTISVDARGATFQNEAALDALVDKVQQRVARMFDAVMGA